MSGLDFLICCAGRWKLIRLEINKGSFVNSDQSIRRSFQCCYLFLTVPTGFDKETWREIPIEYISQVDEGEYIELDCPHYVHDHEYEAICEGIIAFLSEH